MPSEIRKRKDEHLDVCVDEDVEFRQKGTLLDRVHLVHDALPELDVEALDTSCELFGHRLRTPLIITGMTGGTPRARAINRILASLAEEHGVGFGLGSQRAMLLEPDLTHTYEVRDVAPTALVLGNLGAVQARDTSTEQVAAMCGEIGVDALCVHLNAGQEMVQDGGDRDFRGCLEAVARLSAELPIPILLKETGCGLSAGVVRRCQAAGVEHFDVSGAGGTTWVGVEALRSRSARGRLGTDFWDWGIPTAVALLALRGAGATLIGSGGIRSGHDAARAIALGAHAVGFALPILRAVMESGRDGGAAVIDAIAGGLRMAMLLTGSRDLAALRQAPAFIEPELQCWAEAVRR